jgi:hypothetical protein
MGHRLDALDRGLERLATLLFGPQPLGYRLAPSLWAKLVALAFLVAVLAFGIVASWGTNGRRAGRRRPGRASTPPVRGLAHLLAAGPFGTGISSVNS